MGTHHKRKRILEIKQKTQLQTHDDMMLFASTTYTHKLLVFYFFAFDKSMLQQMCQNVQRESKYFLILLFESKDNFKNGTSKIPIKVIILTGI